MGPLQNRRFCGEKFGFFAYYCWAAGALTLVLQVIQKEAAPLLPAKGRPTPRCFQKKSEGSILGIHNAKKDNIQKRHQPRQEDIPAP